jgi:hypothetical protein
MSLGARFGSSTGAGDAGFAATFSPGASSVGGGVAAGGVAGGTVGCVTADFGIAMPALGGMLLTAGGALAIAGFSGSGVGPFFSALRTSPGFEIFEKSNFGLISSDLLTFFSDAPEP